MNLPVTDFPEWDDYYDFYGTESQNRMILTYCAETFLIRVQDNPKTSCHLRKVQLIGLNLLGFSKIDLFNKINKTIINKVVNLIFVFFHIGKQNLKLSVELLLTCCKLYTNFERFNFAIYQKIRIQYVFSINR